MHLSQAQLCYRTEVTLISNSPHPCCAALAGPLLLSFTQDLLVRAELSFNVCLKHAQGLPGLGAARPWHICTDVLLQAFNNMQVRGVEADVVTCCSLISALERGGQWQLAGQLQWRATQVCPSGATLHLPAERCLCVWDKLLPTVSPALSIHSMAGPSLGLPLLGTLC